MSRGPILAAWWAITTGCASPATEILDVTSSTAVLEVVAIYDGEPDPAYRAAGAAVQYLAPSLALVDDVRAEVARELRQGGLARRARVGRVALDVDAARRAAGLPALVLGIPFAESRFDDTAVSRACAAGAWQILPETAVSLGLDVGGCTLRDREDTWTPTRTSVVSRFSPYRGDRACGIVSCAIDERLQTGPATRAAMRYLSRVHDAGDLRDHPLRAPLTVLSYNAGEARMRWWLDEADSPFEQLAACGADPSCGMAREHARYVPRVIAGAALVACNALGDRGWAHTDLCQALASAGLAPPRDIALAGSPGELDDPHASDHDRARVAVERAWQGRDGTPVVEIRRDGSTDWLRVAHGDRAEVAPLRGGIERSARAAVASLAGPDTGQGRHALAEALVRDAAPAFTRCHPGASGGMSVQVAFDQIAPRATVHPANHPAAACVATVVSSLPSPAEVADAVVAVRLQVGAAG